MDAVDIESGHHNKEEDQPIDYVHVMVDLETMGKKHNAPIVAIGAVVFDPATGSIGESFYKVVCLESSVNWGAVIDPSTVIWWLKQSSEARSAIVNDDAIPLLDALLQFREFVSDNVAGGSKRRRYGVTVRHSTTLFCVLLTIALLKIIRGNTGTIGTFEQW